jgi:hypothetical protein
MGSFLPSFFSKKLAAGGTRLPYKSKFETHRTTVEVVLCPSKNAWFYLTFGKINDKI